MKILDTRQSFIFDNYIYGIDNEDRDLKINDILYDSRTSDFIQIESEKDIIEFGFVAPELYFLLKQIGELKE